MTRIALTGGNGKLGRAVARDLTDHGYEVTILDRVAAPGMAKEEFTVVDLTDYGQVVGALAGVDDRHGGVDAVVHLAAIPAPGLATNAATFHNNVAGHVERLRGGPRASASVTSSGRPARPCSGCPSTPRRRTSPSTRSTGCDPSRPTRSARRSRRRWRTSSAVGTPS